MFSFQNGSLTLCQTCLNLAPKGLAKGYTVGKFAICPIETGKRQTQRLRGNANAASKKFVLCMAYKRQNTLERIAFYNTMMRKLQILKKMGLIGQRV